MNVLSLLVPAPSLGRSKVSMKYTKSFTQVFFPSSNLCVSEPVKVSIYSFKVEVPPQTTLLKKKVKSFSKLLASWALREGISLGDGDHIFKYYTSTTVKRGSVPSFITYFHSSVAIEEVYVMKCWTCIQMGLLEIFMNKGVEIYFLSPRGLWGVPKDKYLHGDQLVFLQPTVVLR